MTRVAFENQILKNVTLKFGVLFLVGAFVFGLTVSGAIYAYMQTIEKRFSGIEIRMDKKDITDAYRRIQIDEKFESIKVGMESVQREHMNLRVK